MLHESLADGKILPDSGTCFASASERTHKWSGIEQDITERVQRKLIYEASSVVRLSHSHHTVQATLYVQYLDQREEYIGISRLGSPYDDFFFFFPHVTVNVNLGPNILSDTKNLKKVCSLFQVFREHTTIG